MCINFIVTACKKLSISEALYKQLLHLISNFLTFGALFLKHNLFSIK